MGSYIEDAWALYGHAVGELEEWRRTADDILLRDAAEKAWGAVTLAANELLESQGRVVPDGTNARRDAIRAVERQNRRIGSLRPPGEILGSQEHPAPGLLLRRAMPFRVGCRGGYRRCARILGRCRERGERLGLRVSCRARRRSLTLTCSRSRCRCWSRRALRLISISSPLDQVVGRYRSDTRRHHPTRRPRHR